MLSRRKRKHKRRILIGMILTLFVAATIYLFIDRNQIKNSSQGNVVSRWTDENSVINVTAEEKIIEKQMAKVKSQRFIQAAKDKRQQERELEIRQEEQAKLAAVQKAEAEEQERLEAQEEALANERTEEEIEIRVDYYHELTLLTGEVVSYIEGQLNELSIVHEEYGYAYTNSFRGYQQMGVDAMQDFIDQLNSMSPPPEYLTVHDSIREAIYMLQQSFLEISTATDNGVEFDLPNAFTRFTDGLTQLRLSLEVIFP